MKQTGSPILLQAEYGPQAPIYADAIELDQGIFELFFIYENTGYHFQVTGTVPSNGYSFITSFDFRINSGLNPFMAGMSSTLSNPPSWVHALYISDTFVLAFAGDYLYSYDRASQDWEQKGLIPCP